ncbi:MAG: tetratricopeptide repeat protein [Bacteroidales bacterium]|nr:tetratricopeptide repeat protein [Bacteroidales bacterium]
MRHRILILVTIFLLISTIGVQAQNSPDEINRMSNVDERYNAAKELLEYYRLNALDSLLIFAESIQIVNENDRFTALKEYAYSEYYYEMYDLGKSLNHALDAIFKNENLNKPDHEILSKSYNVAGLCSEQLYRFEKALEYYEKGLYLARHLNDRSLLSMLYSNRSFVYYGMGDMSKAIADLETALNFNTELKDTINLAKDLNNLGFIYTSWGKYDTGIEYYKKALAYSLKKGLKERSAICYNNIGMSYFQQGKYELAEEFISQALEMDKKNGFHLNAAKRYNNLGLVYFQQGKVEKSIEHFDMAAEVFLELGDSVNYAKAIINISDIYFKSGRNTEAFQHLEKGYNISLGTNSIPLIEHNTGKMFRYYKSIGDYKKALEYKELYDELGDSLYSLESTRIVEEMETIYETEKKEDEISRLNTESELKEDIIRRKNQQRNMMAAFAVMLLIVLVATVLIIHKIRKQRHELEALNNVKNRLFAMISHDLRGYSGVFQDAGMVIRHHLKKENFDKVNAISENLEISAISYSSQLDNILNWAVLQLNGYKLEPIEFSPFEECNSLIENLSDIRKLKNNDFENNIDPELVLNMDKGAFNIIVRNLLANANKFTEQGLISVGLECGATGFKLSISDTGTGMDEETKNSLFSSETVKSQRGTRGEKGSGVGLGLVKTFVELSGGRISVESKPGKGSMFHLYFAK